MIRKITESVRQFSPQYNIFYAKNQYLLQARIPGKIVCPNSTGKLVPRGIVAGLVYLSVDGINIAYPGFSG